MVVPVGASPTIPYIPPLVPRAAQPGELLPGIATPQLRQLTLRNQLRSAELVDGDRIDWREEVAIAMHKAEAASRSARAPK